MIHQLQELKPEQKDLLEKILEEINHQETMPGLKSIASAFMNLLMKKEREVFLRRGEGNKANGYYHRDLMSGLGPVDLMIPRDRLSEFRPFLLPEAWQRGDQSYDDLIHSLLIHAYSPNKIRSILKKLDLSYSDSEVEEFKEEIYQRSIEYKTQQLSEGAFCLYIDAYRTKIKEPDSKKVTQAVIHTVIGVDLEGHKEIYGYYEYFGTETKEHWLMILNDLINRGLKKLCLIISDDFSGLSDAILVLFPKTDHQLCFVHLQRNVSRQLSKSDAKDFNDTLKTLKTYRDFDKATASFDELCQRYQSKYPSFIQHLDKNKERYFCFLKYPQSLRKHLYTTNVSENFNSRLEVMRVNLGGYFQSSKTLQIAVQVLLDKIQKNKWRKPIPAFKDSAYEVYQLFNQKFAAGTV